MRMVKDAEAHAEEDRKRKDEVDTINSAEQLVNAAEQALNSANGKVSSDTISAVTQKVSTLKAAIEQKDLSSIKTASENLTTAINSLSQEMYSGVGNNSVDSNTVNYGYQQDDSPIEAEYEVVDA